MATGARRRPAGRSGAAAQRRSVPAWIGTAFAQADAPGARAQRRQVADPLRSRVPGPAALMDTAEGDVLAFTGCPKEHRAKIHGTNPLERLPGGIKRRTDVAGLFPNEAAAVRPAGAILLQQDGRCAVQRRHMSLEERAPLSDAPAVAPPAVAG